MSFNLEIILIFNLVFLCCWSLDKKTKQKH